MLAMNSLSFFSDKVFILPLHWKDNFAKYKILYWCFYSADFNSLLCSLLAHLFIFLLLSSVQFSHSVVYNSLRSHGLQHSRLPCPSPAPRAYSNSCPLSQWCHPTISSSVIPISSCLQSFPASGLFQSVNSLLQVAKVLEFQLQYQSFQWIFRLISFRITCWIFLQSKGLSRVFSNTSSKASILWCSDSFMVQLSHPHMTTGKTIVLTRWTFVGKVMSLLFNILSQLVIAFLSRSRCFLFS